MRSSGRASWWPALAALLLAACGSRAPAPIYERSSNPYERAAVSASRIDRPARYVVRRGDTLYAIAWRYGLDYRELARWNGIGPPYTIHVGRALTLERPRRLPPVPTGGARENGALAAASAERRTAPADAPGTTPARAADGPTAAPRSARETTPRAAVAPMAEPASAPATVRSAPPPPPAASFTASSWRWPAEGPLLSRFRAGEGTRKGIDIGGEAGAPVRAAAAGRVVYSGAGLVGYGELIIIKHDDRYLSAYGHNRRRLVAEGEQVQAGQQIAELGSTGAPRVMLHFEIRDNGEPKDPLSFLPER